MADKQKDNDNKILSVANVWGMAFGCMVGWGAFVMPGTTFLPVAGPAGTVIAMIAGTLIMLVIANNFGFLMAKSPYEGGVYSYTKEAFGRDHAFISSWFLCLSYLTVVFLNGTALFVVLNTLFEGFSHTGFHYVISGNEIYGGEITVSVLALAGIGIMFIIARPLLRSAQTVLAIVLAAGIFLIAVFCIPHIELSDAFHTFGSSNINPFYGAFSIVVLAPWAFVGFDVVSFDTSLFKFDVKRSKKILFTSIPVAGLSYIAMALVAICARPSNYPSWREYISDIGNLSGIDSVPTFFVSETVMGRAGLYIIGITALAGILTGVIGGYRATERVLFAMAEDRILSEKFSKTSYSILFVMVISILLALFGRNTLSWFVDLTSFGAIVGFGYTSAASYKIARTEGNKKVMTTGITGTVISVIFIIVQLVPRLAAMEAMGSEAFLLLSLWCLLGFVFYWRTIDRSINTDHRGMSFSGIVLFALLMYSALMWFAKLIASKDTLEGAKRVLVCGGVVVMIIIFTGLMIMLYVQNLVRKKHELLERDKIRAVESSLAKSRFLFNMSHDIRTPMNAIIGYTDLALKEDSIDKVHGYLEKIDTSNKHLLSLINDILEMSRIESGITELKLAPADLKKIFDDIEDLFVEQMKQKKMDFKVHSSKIDDRYVWLDENNLTRILVNLLSNALKFTPEGGSVLASIGQMGGSEDGYGSYEIRISDNGIGMSKEFVKIMFNPFEREHTSTISGTQGTGLGLAITKRIIDMMGGSIDVLTSPGSGTEIIIRLMLKLADGEEVEIQKGALPDKEANSSVDFSGKRVLLVEDIEINSEIAKTILEQNGFKVEEAKDGQEALDMIADSESGYYDVILMDIQMPVMDGYEATRRIRQLDDKEKAAIPIIAMTANAFKEDEERAIGSGMQSFVPKPIDTGLLIEALAKELG